MLKSVTESKIVNLNLKSACHEVTKPKGSRSRWNWNSNLCGLLREMYYIAAITDEFYFLQTLFCDTQSKIVNLKSKICCHEVTKTQSSHKGRNL